MSAMKVSHGRVATRVDHMDHSLVVVKQRRLMEAAHIPQVKAGRPDNLLTPESAATISASGVR
jgi:hypothetical protein